MQNVIGEIIYGARQKAGLTQDQYGAKYSVSGPAIFKFEKGYVKPSLELWISMAGDATVSQRRAVLIWARAKLPEQFQGYIELQDVQAAEKESENAKKKGSKPDYSKFGDPKQTREILDKDKTLPKG